MSEIDDVYPYIDAKVVLARLANILSLPFVISGLIVAVLSLGLSI